MDIKEIQQSYKNCAARLGDYQLMSKTELANGYCDAEEAGDEEKRSQYYSALMLRYWYKIFKWQQDSASLHLDMTDFIQWLEDAFYVVFYYKEWRYKYKAIVKEGKFIDWKLDANGERIPNPYYWQTDPNAPDKIINRCCFSIRGKYYQYNNKDKRKVNVVTTSIEANVEENGDCALDYLNITESAPEIDSTKFLIQKFIDKNKLIEALVIDGIVNGDSFKTINGSAEFDMRKLVKHLSSINQKYVYEIFSPNYSMSDMQKKALFDNLKALNNTKLYKYINKTLIELKNSSELLSGLI